MVVNSSGNATALIGSEVGQYLSNGTQIGEIWLNTERVLLNINPNITSLTLINNYGTLNQMTTVVPRVFQIGSFFSGLFSAGQATSNIANEKEDKK